MHSFAIYGLEYHEDKFVVGIATESVLEAGFTGLITRAGNLLTAKFKYARPIAGGPIDVDRVEDMMHIVLYSDHFLGVRVFD